MTVGVVRLYDSLSPFRIRPYLTGGIGVYEQRFAVWRGRQGTRLGIYGGGGLEQPIGDGGIVVQAEILLQDYRGWDGSPLNQHFVLGVALSGGLKVRF